MSTISASPHMKSDKPYSQSPSYKRQHPYNAEASVSLKNSINLKGETLSQSFLDIQVNEELDYYKNRCQDLESYVRQLKNELDTTIIRLSKQGVLDEKVELVLRQNQMLSSDIDKLQKNYAQKKTECELWKTKYEQQLNAAVQLKASYELDLRKIHGELKQLEERNQILERDRSHDIEATKTNLSIQNEQQRHNYLSQMEILESQLRKIREYAEQRDKELYDLENKYSQLLKDRDIVEGKLLKENDILRIKLSDSNAEHSAEMNVLKQKLDLFNSGQIDNIKKQYLAQLDILDNEIDKLKGLLDIKNTEIETLILQNQRLRNNYDEEVQSVRVQFDVLKEKMIENEQHFQYESEQIEQKLKQQYQDELTIQAKNNKIQLDTLNNELNQLRQQNDNLSNELSTLQKERVKLIENHTTDKGNQQDQIEQLFNNLKEQEQQKQEQINNLNDLLQLKEKEQQTLMGSYQMIKQQLDERIAKQIQEYEILQTNNKSKINSQVLELKQLKQLIEYKDLKIQQMEQVNQIQKSRITQLQNQIKEQLRKYNKQVSELTSQLREAEINYSNLEQELEDIKTEYQENQNKQELEHKEQIDQIKQEYEIEKQQLQQQLETELENQNNQIGTIQGELKNKIIQYQDLQEKLLQLEGDLQGILENPNEQLMQQYQLRQDIILTKQLS